MDQLQTIGLCPVKMKKKKKKKLHTMRHIESHTASSNSHHSQHARLLTDRSPGATAIRFRYLAGFRMVGQIGYDVFQHLGSRALLHPGEFRRRIRCPFAVDHLSKDPFSVNECRERKDCGMFCGC